VLKTICQANLNDNSLRSNDNALRRFEDKDAEVVSRLIIKTLWVSNIKDYSEQYIEDIVKMFTPECLINRATWTHFFVACDGGLIVGCGAIGPYLGSDDESCLFNVFVLPKYQGKGVGRMIVETLEQDEFFIRARRTKVPASITACEFYKKLGYAHKGGIKAVDEVGLFCLEKCR